MGIANMKKEQLLCDISSFMCEILTRLALVGNMIVNNEQLEAMRLLKITAKLISDKQTVIFDLYKSALASTTKRKKSRGKNEKAT